MVGPSSTRGGAAVGCASAGAVPQEHAEIIAVAIDDEEIRGAVGVQISKTDECWTGSHEKSLLSLEGPIAVAQK